MVQARLDGAPEATRLRRQIIEHVFGTLKARRITARIGIFGWHSKLTFEPSRCFAQDLAG